MCSQGSSWTTVPEVSSWGLAVQLQIWGSLSVNWNKVQAVGSDWLKSSISHSYSAALLWSGWNLHVSLSVSLLNYKHFIHKMAEWILGVFFWWVILRESLNPNQIFRHLLEGFPSVWHTKTFQPICQTRKTQCSPNTHFLNTVFPIKWLILKVSNTRHSYYLDRRRLIPLGAVAHSFIILALWFN